MTDPRVLLKREESYAVHALIAIGETPGVSAAQIAERLQMPPAFMAKVLRKLVRAGMIESQVGRSGGVVLKVAPERVTLLDVIEAMSGTLVLDTCQTRTRCATQERRGHCRLKLAWLATSHGVRELFGAVTLGQLLEPFEPA